MQQSNSPRYAQRILSAHSRIQLRRHRLSADQHRAARDAALRTWRGVAGVASATGRPNLP